MQIQNNIIRLSLLIIICLTCTTIQGKIFFTHIGIDNGLSHSTVFDIEQDNNNLMWIATNDGLNRFDGYTFKIYRHHPNQPTSIGSDIIKTLFFSLEGQLWIGTDKHLSKYDAVLDKFENYSNGAKMPIDHIISIHPNVLLVLTNGKLYEFDIKSSRFRHLKIIKNSNSKITNVYKYLHQVFISTESGLYLHDLKNGKTRLINLDNLNGEKNQIMAGKEQLLWIGTEGNGLFLLNTKTLQLQHYTTANSQLQSNYIRELTFDNQERLWVGTVNGLNIIDRDGNFSAYNYNPLDEGSLSQSSVRSIFQDHQGGIWVGTYFGGLNYFHPHKHQFSNIHAVPTRQTLSNNIINCIVEDPLQKLWIGTNGGINIYTPALNTFEYITQANGLKSNDIKAIHIDSEKGIAYIGSQLGGLGILNIASKSIKTVLSNEKDVDANSIYTILPYENGQELLLGTLTGLKIFNKKDLSIKKVNVSKRPLDADKLKTRSILRDDSDRFWVGTEGGLVVYQAKNNIFHEITPLPKNHPLRNAFVFCIAKDANSQLWIGTRQGAYLVNPQNGKIRSYTTENGLPSNMIYGITQDNKQNIWFSTGNGICRFNLKNQQMRNYTYTDGIQNNQFSPNAFCKTRNGHLFFGGVKGITSFFPDQLTDNPYAPKAIISELRLFNKTVSPNDETNILKKQIAFTDRIVLSHSQSVFSLEFVVSNYIAGPHNTFAYMLEGYDSKWHYTKTARTVTYSRLPHGTYTFKVMAANDDNLWNKEPTTLEIIVLPIWYRTWWARVLFILLGLSAVYLGFRYALSRKMVQLQLLQERQDKKRIQEVNDMKQRFFINVTHEFRTPLTLIASPLSELRDQIIENPWARRQLSLIERNVNHMLHLVNQLMDYRRTELGVFKLQVAQIDLQQQIERICSQFEQLAQKKDINYSLDSQLTNPIAWFDVNYLELILNNLLYNAFKYTQPGQNVKVSVWLEYSAEAVPQTVLQVSDTGQGIPKDQQNKIFERFYQIDSNHMGSGVGLSIVHRLVELHHGKISLKSELGTGSIFTITIPNTKKLYHEDELAKEGTPTHLYSVNSPNLYLSRSEDDDSYESSCLAVEDNQLPTLLIVEDNTDILHHLHEALSSQFNIIEAMDGQEAIERLNDFNIDIVITDVMMPRMDGLQLCQHIKQNVQTCHIPVIMLSAKVDIQEQLDGLRIGANDYITKPFSIAIVKTKLQNLIRNRQQAIAHYTQTQQVEPKAIATNAIDEQLLNQAIEIVNSHIDDADFSTEIFAREMLMSRSNLHLKLKALTGESANDFIRRIRFNKACELIKQGNYTISEISYMVGFNSPSYFATSFKKRFGCMPTEYGKKST